MKRIIVLMLACLMLLSVVPFAVFAEEDVHETEATTEQIECPQAKIETEETHTVTAVKTKAPQCGERGYTLYSCSCGELFLGNYVEAAEGDSHKYELVEKGIEATCDTAGKTDKYVCSVCEKVKPGSGDTIDPTEKHNYIKDGDAIVCEFCGVAQKEEVACKSEAGHVWDYINFTKFVAPTCAIEGSATIKCTVEDCGATKTVIVEATGDHEYGELVDAVAATCTTAGNKAYYTCKNCDRYFDAEKNATEVVNGKTVLFNPVIAKLGHQYACTDKDAVVNCVRTGCSAEVSREEATIKHPEGSYNKDDSAKATCTTYGFTVETCTACGLNEIIDRVEPLGHKWAKTGTVSGPNVCGQYIKTYNCERTGCTETHVVPMNEAKHTWESKVITEATCTTKKATANRCKLCGFVDEATIVYGDKNPANHKVTVNGVTTKVTHSILVDSTCDKAGTGLLECPACGVKELVTIAAKGHTISYYDAKGENTADKRIVKCYYDNTTVKTAYAACDVCNYESPEKVDIVIPAHKKADSDRGTSVPATCTTAAYKEYTCIVCTEDKGTTVKYQVYSGEKLPYDVTKDTYASKADAVKVHGNRLTYAPIMLNADGSVKNCADMGKVYYICGGCNEAVIVVGTGTAHTYPTNYVCGWNAETMGALKCTVCNAALTVKATDHKLVLDTETMNPATNTKRTYAPTCTAAGNEYYVCANAYCTFTDNKIVAEGGLGHDYKVITEGKVASCLLPSVAKEEECARCGDIRTETVVPKTGHTFATLTINNITTVAPTCERAGFTVYDCINCMYEYADAFKAPVGHLNAAGKNPVYACDDEVEDRTCVNDCCDFEDGEVPTHTVVAGTEVEGTCTVQGYIVEICSKCDKYENIILDENFGVHVYAADILAEEGYTEEEIIAAVEGANPAILKEAGIIYTPVLYKDGKIEFGCVYCGVIDETKTIAISAEEKLEDKYGKTLGLTLAVDNANKAGAGFSDSSLVAVTVNLNSVEDLGVWGVNFKFAYNFNKLTYVGFEFAEDSAFDGYTNAVQKFIYAPAVRYESLVGETIGENDKVTFIETEVEAYYEVERALGAYITIGANTANDVNGNSVEAVINGENIALVTLYFEVNDFVDGIPGVDADVTDEFDAFRFGDVMVLNKKAEEVNKAYETMTTITVEKFLDINADAHVNYADVLAMWKMISGEAEVEYNVVADVDKNGVIEAKDFMDLYSFVLGELDYEDMVAIVAAA